MGRHRGRVGCLGCELLLVVSRLESCTTRDSTSYTSAQSTVAWTSLLTLLAVTSRLILQTPCTGGSGTAGSYTHPTATHRSRSRQSGQCMRAHATRFRESFDSRRVVRWACVRTVIMCLSGSVDGRPRALTVLCSGVWRVRWIDRMAAPGGTHAAASELVGALPACRPRPGQRSREDIALELVEVDGRLARPGVVRVAALVLLHRREHEV